jgi:hypothetical protein
MVFGEAGTITIDKGIPTSGLLAHVLVAKCADHLPLYLFDEPIEVADEGGFIQDVVTTVTSAGFEGPSRAVFWLYAGDIRRSGFNAQRRLRRRGTWAPTLF